MSRPSVPLGAAALLALLLLALAPPPVAGATDDCLLLGRGSGRVCEDLGRGGGCVWAAQLESAPSTPTERQCVFVYGRDGVTYACAQTSLGVVDASGAFTGVAASECVATYEWDTARCVVAWGEAGAVTWHTDRPVCAVEPIPLG